MDAGLRYKILMNVMMHPESGCWLWQRSKSERGYGQTYRRIDGTRVTSKVHILAYEEWVEPVPLTETGRRLDLDHECHNRDTDCEGGPTCWHRACCNPMHLRPKTRRQNLAASTKSRSSVNAARTHCPKNHRYPTESIPGESRRCPKCHAWRESARQWNRRHPEAPRPLDPPALPEPE